MKLIKKDLIDNGWEFINKKSVCPESMQDIDYAYYKNIFGRDFYIKHYQDDDILVISTRNEPNKNYGYYMDSCEIKTMDEVEKFVSKWVDL